MNKPSTKVFWLLLGVSTALHAVLLVGWFYTSENTTSSITKEYAINVTLSSDKDSTTARTTNKQYTLSKKNHPVNHKAPTRINNSSKEDKKTASARNKNQVEKLHKLLHTAINANKHYPLSALRLNREGTVKLTFQLLNNGEINSLKVSNSSGHNALDRAALKAVESIQPFKPARQYIASVEKFILNIKFQI